MYRDFCILCGKILKESCFSGNGRTVVELQMDEEKDGA
jgi:hypothetical protein